MSGKSLRSYVDSHFEIGDYKVSRSHPLVKNKKWIFLEGKDDVSFYTPFFHEHEVIIQQMQGCSYVQDIVQSILLLWPSDKTKTIGIVDADFARLDKDVERGPNIFWTDCHDRELMYICSNSAFLKVCFRYLPERQASSLLSDRQMLLESISFLGAVRWWNHRKDVQLKKTGSNSEFLGLKINGLKYRKTLCTGSYIIDAEKLASEILNQNRGKTFVLEEIKALHTQTQDYWNLCQGHDFLSMFCIYIAQETNFKITPGKSEINVCFCEVFTMVEFCTTQLYKDLKTWEQSSNTQILKPI